MSGIDAVAVVGAGAWGTALALVAKRAGRAVTLIGRDPATIRSIAGGREHPRALPGILLDPPLSATTELDPVAGADLVVFAVPAQATRAIARRLAGLVRPGAIVMSAAKGFEQGSLAGMTAVVRAELPAAVPAVVSGPSFAGDVARGLPTAVTIAAQDISAAERAAAALAGPGFRPYASADVTGVEVGGALKNVLAIAAGAVIGRGLGPSAAAALIARGFAELSRLGTALGAATETLSGLSGLGDLVLTATNPQSRNFSLGLELGRGGDPAASLASGKLAEGAFTAEAAVALGKRHGVELPISEAVRDVLSGFLSVDAAIERLLARPLKRETQ